MTNTADVQKLYELISDGFAALSVVEVPANGSVTVYATVTLTSEDKAYMDENYPNGIYVDGFVRAYALTEGAVDLSLPFLGFYGDWSQPPVFDSAWYYEDRSARSTGMSTSLFHRLRLLGLAVWV
ncbi:MAG: hypothetical protein ACLU9S_19600 [Oscillospiraceae bacterium]